MAFNKMVHSLPSLLLFIFGLLPLAACSNRMHPKNLAITDTYQTDAQDLEKSAETPNQVNLDTLITEIKTQPPEAAADLLIRLANSSLVQDKRLKESLLEEAFQKSSEVQNPFKLGYYGDVDTREGYDSAAFDLSLDSLSLQCKVIRLLLNINKVKARELFRKISPGFSLKLVGCKNPMFYDLVDFYTTLGKIVTETFTEKEKKQFEDTNFLLLYINRVKFPAQVRPMASLLTSLKISSPQKTILINEFAKSLRAVADDDRAFVYAASGNALNDSIKALVDSCQAQHIDTQTLLDSYRSFIIKHLTGNRCADNVRTITSNNVTAYQLPKSVNYANEHLFTYSPITQDEYKPASVIGEVELHPHWETPKSAFLLKKLNALRFGSGKTPLSAEEKSKTQWQIDLRSYLNELSLWNSTEERSESDYFQQKCRLYDAMLKAVVPHGQVYEEVLNAFTSFLHESQIQRSHRIEWILQIDLLIGLLKQPGRTEGNKYIQSLRRSKNSTIRLYATIATLNE